MSNFRVSKIKNNHHETLASAPFDTQEEAEQYAKDTSKNDHEHFYVIEKKMDDIFLDEFDDEEDTYDDVKYYVNGEVGTRY